ncbi:universal stress protein [Umezawaea endophytica]|uniref:Universal stress protein n=1 Tax=Umezawaea endophytica TaxID=1654476 RepID=A0A9X2VMW5_9PSEU|nr:universal stress protein [Umezawaea endophytica]MCS7479359.1 universal stress protein [Umezawaea endophytica]
MNQVPRHPSRSEATGRSPLPVVVGNDGSLWGQAALRWAAEHAWRTGAVLDVWLWDRMSDVPDTVPRNGGLNYVTSSLPMLRVRVHESGPDPVRDLETAGRASGLVVVGYRGHSASSFTLGGNVLPLVRRATCDTVVVRGRPSAVRGDNRRVTALISGGEDDDLVVVRAAAMALDHRAALRVVHALPLPMNRDALAADHQFVLDRAARLLEKLDRRPIHTVVLLHGQPHEAVARCTDSDLLVVGAGEQAPRTGRCGAITRTALHQAPCPVLVVHRPHVPEPRQETAGRVERPGATVLGPAPRTPVDASR